MEALGSAGIGSKLEALFITLQADGSSGARCTPMKPIFLPWCLLGKCSCSCKMLPTYFDEATLL
jgi:hypothetical protein